MGTPVLRYRPDRVQLVATIIRTFETDFLHRISGYKLPLPERHFIHDVEPACSGDSPKAPRLTRSSLNVTMARDANADEAYSGASSEARGILSPSEKPS